MMKKLISLGLVCVCGISLLTACSENDGNKNESTINTSSKIKEKAESTEFISKGDYKVGEDIPEGNYYVVLTDLEHSPEDTNKLTEVYINISDNNKKHLKTIYFSQPGQKERIKLEKDNNIQITDNGIEFKNFTLKFLNDSDFKEYMKNPVSSTETSKQKTVNSDVSNSSSQDNKQSDVAEKKEVSTEAKSDVATNTLPSEDKNTNDITKLADEPTLEQQTVLDTLAKHQFNDMYPYKGSKMHSIIGVIQPWTQKDGKWYQKVSATIVNAYGAKREANVEIHITPQSADSGLVEIIDY
ncbi:hypothetical protein [Enterococcus faecalis]|uniref:hypothetical protein n=1 Tax=Enterococcus faecalis TaxID=1351 RepID=UPI0001B2EF05|nr:predicted protein [Enterococcus faecalis CH188]